MRRRFERRSRRCGRTDFALPCPLAFFIAVLTSTTAFNAESAANGTQDFSCPQVGASRAAVASINEQLEISLKDGRTLRLAGVESPRPTPDAPDFAANARDVLAKRLQGQIIFTPLAQQPDRWGRVPAFVFFDSSTPGNRPLSAAQFVLAGDYGRFLPEPEAHPCPADFLAAESAARTAKLGVWRDPYYAVIAATDRSAFTEKAATNVVVESKLVAVDRGTTRTYLEFAPRSERSFSVTIVQRYVKIFHQAGFDFHALIGRTLRVRGLLDLRFGPQIEISSSDEIELIQNVEEARGMGGDSDAKAATPPEKPR